LKWYVIGEEYASDGMYLDVVLGLFGNKAKAVDFLLLGVDRDIYPQAYVIPQAEYDEDETDF
jgi:hypothetical protein